MPSKHPLRKYRNRKATAAQKIHIYLSKVLLLNKLVHPLEHGFDKLVLFDWHDRCKAVFAVFDQYISCNRKASYFHRMTKPQSSDLRERNIDFLGETSAIDDEVIIFRDGIGSVNNLFDKEDE